MVSRHVAVRLIRLTPHVYICEGGTESTDKSMGEARDRTIDMSVDLASRPSARCVFSIFKLTSWSLQLRTICGRGRVLRNPSNRIFSDL